MEKNPRTPEEYARERNQTFDLLLGMVGERLAALPVTFLSTPTAETAPQIAERESWQLISSAIQHLKEGGPVIGKKDGEPLRAPGLLTTAISKASLRHSSLAASLGIPVPRFEQMISSISHDDGHAEAYFLCRRLIEAASNDITKSEQMIRAKIAKAGGDGLTAATGDAMLDKIFDAVKKGLPSPLSTPEENILNDRAAFAIQEQMEKTCAALVSAHIKTCDLMLQDMDRLRGHRPSGPRNKPGRYKL